jgi:hypothetical protein
MQPEVPTQSFIWGELARRFESELTRQKSVIWRLSGMLEEYGSPPGGDRDRELEQKTLIEELTRLSVQAVICELAHRQSANSSSRRRGRPKDVITPYLAPKLLSVFLRCHDRAGRQSVATSVDGKATQREAGELFKFIEAVIETLNQYLTTELGRRPLSAARLARFALDDRRSMVQALEQSNALAMEATLARKLQLALLRAFAVPE